MADRRLRECGRVAVVLGLLLCTSACSTKITGTIPTPVGNSGSGSFKAGAASVDLTPIPGIPMAGYSMGGKIARGAWVRLRARALYLEDAGGDALVLVACDLDQIPNGLSDRVAKLLRSKTTVHHLGREQIVLGASHTHHGPGNFFSERMYNSFATPRSGFDEELFEFLAARIVKAIETAYASSTPAILRTAPAPGSGPNDRLPCVFRNRSLPAFERNPNAEVVALRAANPCPAGCCPARCPDTTACESVHTQIDYFSVVDAAVPTRVIGVGVFLAGHATVLSPNNELYSPDFFGVTSTLLETGKAGCLGGASPPVVAVFNGAEGDVSPAWEQGKRDRRNVLEIAEEIAARVCAILPAAVNRPTADIAFRWGEIEELANQGVDDPFDRRPGWEQHTAAKARVGAAALGGAEDGRTILHEMGFVEGLRGPVRDDQGVKESLEIRALGTRTSVGAVAAVNEPPPEQAPMGVYTLGNLALVTLPGEFTTMLGERIRNHVAGKLAVAPDRVVLMGLTGGHVSYVTTPEEFEAQHYEGAQNIYGAATGPLMADELGKLAADVGAIGPPPTPRSYQYDPGKELRWRVREAAGPPYEVNEGVGDVVQDLVTGKPRSDFPTFCFRDSVPRLSKITPDGVCERTMPDVQIETSGGVPVSVAGVSQNSSRGLDVVTVLTGVGADQTTGKDATEWCAIWLVPETTTAGDYRFHIERIRGPALTSAVFQAGGLSPPVFYSPTDEPLIPDRRDSIFCDSAFDFLGLCPEPQTCELP